MQFKKNHVRYHLEHTLQPIYYQELKKIICKADFIAEPMQYS